MPMWGETHLGFFRRNLYGVIEEGGNSLSVSLRLGHPQGNIMGISYIKIIIPITPEPIPYVQHTSCYTQTCLT